MSNETKVGILAVVIIALSIWGYRFIQGTNLLSASKIYYVEYDNVNMLKEATPVVINGFRVGVVRDIYLKSDDQERIVVVLETDKDINIPKDAVATITSTSFMGGKAIQLLYEKGCVGPDCAKSGDYLQGSTLGMLGSFISEDDANAYVNIVRDGLQDVIDTLNYALLSDESNSPLAKSIKDLSSTLSNLKSTTFQMDGLLRKSSGNIDGTLASLASITGGLEAKNDNIKHIIDNADSLTTQLAEANLRQTIGQVNAAIDTLKLTLTTANKAIDGVSGVLAKLDEGQGTLGMLLKDEKLYYNLNDLSRQTDSLFNDIQDRPYRYIPFKGKKKVKKYDRQDAKEELEANQG